MRGNEPSFNDYVQYHDKMPCAENYKPTPEQHQAIIASIIGDGYLAMPYKSKTAKPNARIVWNMGNEKHARHKLEFFKFLGARMHIKENAGWGSTMYSVVTKSHPILTAYRENYYDSNGNKRVKAIVDELDWFGWAWLYGDDGHLGRGSCYLHSEGYGIDGTQHYKEAIDKITGIKDGSSIHHYIGGTPKKDRYCLRLKNETSKVFMDGVKEHMADGMEYKIM